MVSLHWSPCWRSWQAEGVCVCVCVGRITGGGGLLCLESFRLPVSHTRTLCCCCCFKKQSLLVKPTADNFNAPSCRPGPGGVAGVGSCGEVGRAAQYSRISSPGLDRLNLGLIGVSEPHEMCQFCAQDGLSRAL